MKNNLLVVVFFLLVVSCAKNEGYVLTGNFKGMPNQQLELRFCTFESTVVVNSTVTDSTGNFCFEGKVSEPGIYAIKPSAAGDDQYITFFLENTPLALSVDATHYDYEITDVSGSERSEKFEALRKQYKNMLKESERFSTELESLKSSLSSSEYQNRVDEFDSTFVAGLKQTIDQTPDLIHKIYLLSLLNLQAEFPYIKNTMKAVHSEESQSVYLKQFNDKIAFADKILSQYQAE